MAQRKVQQEIDKVIKKISEGLELFEDTFQKLYNATSQSQKEKFEVELKKEIKKLQRLRDQIKTWLSSPDIKDKRVLLENRRLIETQMERFKATEREMKTKQYSKEGLQAKEKLDPADIARHEASNWMTAAVDNLNTQIDVLEAEQEAIHAQKSRKVSKQDQERLKSIDVRIAQHKFHVLKLETMLRLFENENLTLEDVDSVKDSVDYYIESNNDPDFMEDDEMYDHLDLLEEETFGVLEEHHVHDHDESEGEELVRKNSGKEPGATSPKVKAKVQKVEKVAPVIAEKPVVRPVIPDVAPTPCLKPEPIKQQASTVVYAAAAASASPKLPTATVKAKEIPSEDSSKPSASFSHIVAAQKQEVNGYSEVYQQEPLQQIFLSRLFPSDFIDLVAAHDMSRLQIYGRGDEVLRNQMLVKELQHSLTQCPDIMEEGAPANTKFNSPWKSGNVEVDAILSTFPQRPLINAHLPVLYERLDIDTLFFIFYNSPGTKEQILAARELKRQSWRFHKKYLTWFQRHEEPKTITDEYEQGTYIYFDYEGSWCQRKKADFTFEYRFLEDEQ